jgi:hypothetical protein
MQPGVVIPSAFVPELKTKIRDSVTFRRKSTRSATHINMPSIGKIVSKDRRRHEL